MAAAFYLFLVAAAFYLFYSGSGEADNRRVHIVLETSLLLQNLELCEQLRQNTSLQLHVPRLVLQVSKHHSQLFVLFEFAGN
jgi:hypothetical protein